MQFKSVPPSEMDKRLEELVVFVPVEFSPTKVSLGLELTDEQKARLRQIQAGWSPSQERHRRGIGKEAPPVTTRVVAARKYYRRSSVKAED